MSETEHLIDDIAKRSGKSREEINELINAKLAKFNNVLTMDTALKLVITEDLKLDMSSETFSTADIVTIDGLVPEMVGVAIQGILIRSIKTKEFKKRDGSPGYVKNLTLQDAKSSIKVVLWDLHALKFDKMNIEIGAALHFANLFVKEGYNSNLELHSTSQTTFRVLESRPSHLPEYKASLPSKIGKIEIGRYDVKTRGKVLSTFPRKTYSKPGGGTNELVSILIGDETASCRLTFWNRRVSEGEALNQDSIIDIVDASSRKGYTTAVDLNVTPQTQISQVSDPSLEKADLSHFLNSTTTTNTPIQLKLNQIKGNEKNLTILGKVVRIFDMRTFQNTNKNDARVQSILIQDDTGKISVSFWNDDTSHIKDIQIGDIIEIKDSYARNNNYGISVNFGYNSTLLNKDPTEVDTSIRNIDASLTATAPTSDITPLSEIPGSVSIVNVIVRIKKDPVIRDIERNDGRSSVVANLIVEDETHLEATLVGWNEEADKLQHLKLGDTVEVTNLRTKTTPEYGLSLTLQSNSSLTEKSTFSDNSSMGVKKPESVSFPQFLIKDLEDQVVGTKVKIEATLIEFKSQSNVFPSCPVCSRRVNQNDDLVYECKNHGVQKEQNKLIISAFFEDQTGRITGIFFDKTAEDLIGLSADEAAALVKEQENEGFLQSYAKDRVLHKLYTLSGVLRMNRNTKKQEIFVSQFDQIANETQVKELLDAL